jgi:GH24 family phage-related lysozyme (muramidase)
MGKENDPLNTLLDDIDRRLDRVDDILDWVVAERLAWERSVTAEDGQDIPPEPLPFPPSKGREVSQAGLDFIKQWEGWRPVIYMDTGGKPTIGYGHLITPERLSYWQSKAPITKAEGEVILANDIDWAEAAVREDVTTYLSDRQFDVLVSFVFNIGRGRFKTSTLLRLLNKGDYQGVPGQLMRWVNSGGKRTPGLVNRRNAEARIWDQTL